jgi:hypothetical protein
MALFDIENQQQIECLDLTEIDQNLIYKIGKPPKP